MDFLDIPGELVAHNILPNLGLADLLRLRRTCKTTKALVNDHIRHHVRTSTPQLVIGFQEADLDTSEFQYITIRTLLESEVHLPTCNFYLLYDGSDKYGGLISEFLDKYGNQVTHLRVSRLVAPTIFKVQNNLYTSLRKLTHLVVDELILAKPDPHGAPEEMDQILREAERHFPATFKKLKHFEVKTYWVMKESRMSHSYFWKLIEFCDNLEYLSLPKFRAADAVERDVVSWPDGHVVTYPRDYSTFGTFCFNYLRTLLKVRKARAAQAEDGGGFSVQLKFLDIGDMEEVRLSATPTTPVFAALMTELVANDVKLLNAKADFLHHVEQMPEAEEAALAAMDSCVTSLHGLSVHWLKVKLPLLERLSLRTSYTVTLNTQMFDQPWTRYPLPKWPALKSLDLIVESKRLVDGHDVKRTLFKILFGIERESLEELNLSFMSEPDSGLPEGDLTGIPVPSTADLMANCFNLRKLTISAWNGTNKAISELWKGLPRLEEVTLEGCAKLGNAAFVGEDSENPTFLLLKDLKKLSLKSLDKMSKITDTSFSLVFCHLPLREFRLTCSDKESLLISITSNGIKALLSGKFATTIERFPFTHWTLANVDESQFRELRDEFKCSQML